MNIFKKITCLFFSLMILLSCEHDEVDVSDLEKEIEILKENIENQQSVISLLSAYSAQKKIVMANRMTDGLYGATKPGNNPYWKITFSDNTTINVLVSAVTSLTLNENTSEYKITLFDDQVLVFNGKEIVYPTGLVTLTNDIKFMKNTEVSIEFRVNPSNAIFNYDVNTEDCQIEFDMAEKINTYSSYVTSPEKCRLTRIEQVKNEKGEVKEGQYRAYIRDKGESGNYKYTTAIVLSSVDKNGDSIQFSTSAISLERKKDTRLPVVVIHTQNKADIKDKENWISGTMTIDGINKFDNYAGTMSIRGRGNSTWTNPKKPFAIKLDNKSEILGMPSHKRWVLLANYMDRTLMRNKIAFEISKVTDLEWTPRGEFVEVMLNDVHLGNYYLCEQIKLDKNRVDIAEMKASDIDEESITGGYLIEMDLYYDEVNKFRSEICDLPVMLKEPEEIQPQQFEYIQNYINSFERALYSEDFAITREYASYIADTTFVDWWIVMELTRNFEASHPKSCYIYKDRLGSLKAGPVWDFDWGTFTHKSDFIAMDAIWYSRLFKDPVFVRTVKARWERFKPQLEEIVLLMENERKNLSNSAELNDAMWSISNDDVVNGDEHLSYSDAVKQMKKNYEERLTWLDSKIRSF